MLLQNKVLRGIFRFAREEVIEHSRKLHSEKLHKLFSSKKKKNTIRGKDWKRMRLSMLEVRNALNILWKM
jgi:hypothetical protein